MFFIGRKRRLGQRIGSNQIHSGKPRIVVVQSPTIAGTLNVGDTLTVTVGKWYGTKPFTYSYQWFADNVAIDGATNSTYELTIDEVGANITCQVTLQDRYRTLSETSNELGPVTNV